ncbi:MAG: SDR family NAD(P)-dependent oxidoreductase [Phycisphaerales bacterium]|nr:MAG: SDR family NAD(P)-dependent oxidoreductase [Phycisphaerales bacterium]
MRALITGGAGFIGSHLAERLLRDGAEVVVIDNLSTGCLENIEGFKEHPRFDFIEGDIRNSRLVETSVEHSDAVFHLAAAVGVQLIADKPVHTIETNIGGTETVLEKANKFGKKVLIASSSEVYGKSENVPFGEDDDIVLGSTSVSRWAYACSKAIDEFLGQAFYQQYGLQVVIGRFFNTIGPRQTGRYGMVVPRFVERALKGEPILIYGTGKQSRCFCCVDDLVDAIVGLMRCKRAPGKVFNIGSTEEISIQALADKVIEMTHSKSKKKCVPYETAYGRPIEDMMRRVPNVERINRTIGWEARTSLSKTLEAIIDNFRKQLETKDG